VAPPAGTLRVGRYFLALAILLAILYSIVGFGSRHTPKLGIDLVGGTQVVFTAKTESGGAPSSDSMSQARNILADRVNGSGVTQATVQIQGTDQIVVSIPGQSADIRQLGKAAKLNMRGLVLPAVQTTCTPKSATTGGTNSPAANSPSGSAPTSSPAANHSGAAAGFRPLGRAPGESTTRGSTTRGTSTTPSGSPSGSTTPSGTTTSTGSATPSTSASPSVSTPAGPSTCSAKSVADALASSGITKPPLTQEDYAALTQAQKSAISAGLANFDCDSGTNERDEPDTYFVACQSGTAFYLGPVVVPGTEISSASALSPDQNNLSYRVGLNFKSSGESAWAKYTAAHNVNSATPAGDVTSCSSTTTPCADWVGFTLDGAIISIPYNQQAINGGTTEISGNFDSTSAHNLANELKYGALPLTFHASAAQNVSATLGTSQLKAGMLAGGIGLILVVIYSLIYYRALGLVTIASLLVSGVLVYGSLVLLASQIGFTLSLAGIAGFIVAVGITADSFVVFFERLKDEVHEGRSARVAVPRAWARARRTILSADTVSFLAAAVLYYFTTDEVRGFAFTLGLSTILDLAVVFLFTHPMVSLLSRMPAFGSARFTGLDAIRGAPAPASAPSPRRSRSSAPAEPEPRGGGTAVLVKTDEDESSARVDDEPEPDTPAEPDDQPRRRTAPEPGSAAERAAARRARLRAEQDEKGES
jgi:preprotein translocase subunit SecD